ncbi:unnamed protein product [Ambrosiozyma monospora]|uniref:Unnamed protein product n=1 Tax=Ambrosiozyma monospora TaxID=43982 RepID=A0ACB5TGS0_AMBMO|nr:unnamed protein product [Ambrosiozyma monospora]
MDLYDMENFLFKPKPPHFHRLIIHMASQQYLLSYETARDMRRIKHTEIFQKSFSKEINSSKLVRFVDCYDELYVDCLDTLERLPLICQQKVVQLKTRHVNPVREIRDCLPNLRYLNIWIGSNDPYIVSRLILLMDMPHLQQLTLTLEESFNGVTEEGVDVLAKLSKKPNFKILVELDTRFSDGPSHGWPRSLKCLSPYLSDLNLVLHPETRENTAPEINSFKNLEKYEFGFYKHSALHDCDFSLDSSSLKELSSLRYLLVYLSQ